MTCVYKGTRTVTRVFTPGIGFKPTGRFLRIHLRLQHKGELSISSALSAAVNDTRGWEHVDPSNPSNYPTVDYEEVMSSDSGVAKWTDLIVCPNFIRSMSLLHLDASK